MNPIRTFAIGTLIAAASAGGIGAASLAYASTTDTTPTTTVAADTTDTADAPTTPDAPRTANGITETPLTGDTAAGVEAAVTAAYPDATIDRMETDADGATYEAHITLADGSHATVELDDSFTITATETGGGRGGHGGGGDHGGPRGDETPLTGDTAAGVESAVTAAYPDATIDRMETDADGATYEAHITLADGTHSTVKLDDSFTITATEAGNA